MSHSHRRNRAPEGRAVALCLGLSLAFGAGATRAQQAAPTGGGTALLPDWSISGSNTVHYEQYVVGGDETSSPYTFEGPHPYDDVFLNFNRRVSAYERWNGSFAGVANDSRYRSTDSGLTAERLNMTWEKGDTAVPYRLELGDYYGYYSFRTLQRSLKGAQIDLQPSASLAGERHSVMALGGFVNPTWRHIDAQDDAYTGLSWLIEHDALGTFTVNGLHNFRQADATSPDRDQNVFSLGGERKFVVGGQRLTVEGEIARLTGDVGSGSTTRTGASDNGYFAQIRGASDNPLTYSLRFEDYGVDYRPNGASITSNRRSWELRGGWRFDSGLQARGRLQSFTDSMRGATALDTETVGLTLAGPVPFDLLPNSSGRLDTFIQKRSSNDDATDTVTRSLRFDTTTPLPDDWLGRFGATLQSVADRNTDSVSITRQLDVSADHAISVRGLRGAVTPGILVRNLTGSSDSLDFGPSIAVFLGDDRHSLNASYRALAQVRESATSLLTHDAAASYEYRLDRHTLGAEIEYQNRDPTDLASTNSFKFAVFWRMELDRPAPSRQAAGPAAPQAVMAFTGPFRLTNLPPGQPLGIVQRELTRAQISGGVFVAGAKVFETRMLEDIAQRQRLVVVFERGRLTRTALIVDLDDVGSADTTAQTFERVREVMVRRHGRPARIFEQGTITAALADDVNRDRFIRNLEWDTAAGVLRLGIPRRLDRQVRIEVQLAQSFPPPRQTLWSLERIR